MHILILLVFYWLKSVRDQCHCYRHNPQYQSTALRGGGVSTAHFGKHWSKEYDISNCVSISNDNLNALGIISGVHCIPTTRYSASHVIG